MKPRRWIKAEPEPKPAGLIFPDDAAGLCARVDALEVKLIALEAKSQARDDRLPGMPEVTAVDREAVRKEFFRVYLADTPKAKSVAFIRCAKDAAPSMSAQTSAKRFFGCDPADKTT